MAAKPRATRLEVAAQDLSLMKLKRRDVRRELETVERQIRAQEKMVREMKAKVAR